MNEHNRQPPTPEKKAEVERLFRAYQGKPYTPPSPVTTRRTPESPTLASVVFRLSKKASDALDALAAATRIRRSEYLREAIADVLKKHEETP